MSSPHLGGGFVPLGGGSARSASGRNTPSVAAAGSPRVGSSAGQQQYSYPRPQAIGIAGAGGDARRGARREYDSDDEEEAHVARQTIGTGSWRPVGSGSSPRHVGMGVSPRNNHYVPAGTSFTASSRAAYEQHDAVYAHAADPGRLPAADPESQFIGTEAADAAAYGGHDCMLVGGDAGSAEGGVAPEVHIRFADLPPVLKGYLLGQIASVIKFGLWWVAFTSLILALFGGSSYLVGATRICFNGALLFCSPLSGALVEKTNIKRLLNRTVAMRGVLYCVAIPLAWLLMDSGLLYHRPQSLYDAFFVVFLLIVFVDGVGVSFSNVADVDSGGVNLVAMQYGLEIDDNIRTYFNSLHILFFDASMVVFNPVLAYLGLFIGQHTVKDSGSISTEVVDEMTLLIAIGGVFLISTLLTLFAYNYYMPDLERVDPNAPEAHSMQPLGASNGAEDDHSLNAFAASSPSQKVAASEPAAPAEPSVFSWSSISELAASVKEGAGLTWANRRIRWRVLFFAVETSVEDAMIALIAAEVGANVFAAEVNKDDEDLKYAWGNLWGAALVATGKLGGVIASVCMHKWFRVNEEEEALNPGKAYKPLFWFAFLGGCCSLLLPIGLHLQTHSDLSHWVTGGLMFASMFLFFIFSTLSKIGFATLMQSLAAEVEATGRVFGFVAAFVTATDAAVLMILAALFSSLGLQSALWATTAFIAVHGLIELVVGPGLVLGSSSDDGVQGKPSLDDHFMPDAETGIMHNDLQEPLM